jgi:hypothetical protein
MSDPALLGRGGPGVPTSTVTVQGGQVTYCVTGYAPRKAVAVDDPAARIHVRLHTGIRGVGCTSWPAPTGCDQSAAGTAVATGLGADGNPATSSATVQVPLSATCAPSPAATHRHSALGGSVSLSSAGIVLLVVAGVALISVVVIGLVAGRRRRALRSG